jgi:oligoribonuclease NrnB/cAMP/cGMP phosphodiesterase (DHH superfamily)
VINLKNINENSKALNISHHDFDGVSCAIVLSNYFKDITCKSCTFSNIDSMIKKIEFEKYDVVFITDCFPKNPEILTISDKIIIIDHHQTSQKLCNMTNIISFGETCAAMLVKFWIEDKFKVSLSHLDNLIKLTNDYDLWTHNYKESKQIERLFWYYSYYDFKDRFLTGNVKFTDGEKLFLSKKEEEFDDLYNNLELFEMKSINGCFCAIDGFINDIADKLLHVDNYDVVIVQNLKNKNISVRSKDDDVNIGDILERLNIGGGHPKAGGFTLREKIEYQKDNFEKLENYLFENIQQWRK